MVDDPTFPYRVLFGLAVFGVLGAVDAVRNPRDPRRLKEYAFLFAVTAAVMLYGLLHDALTFSLSPEYFSVVKGLRAPAFFPDIAQLALAASWTVGLVIGVVFLVANNPSKRWLRLPYARLVRHLVWPLAAALLSAACLAMCSLIAPTWCIAMLGVATRGARDDAAVTTAWAIHIGTYLGAALGLVLGVVRIVLERASAPSACERGPGARERRVGAPVA